MMVGARSDSHQFMGKGSIYGVGFKVQNWEIRLRVKGLGWRSIYGVGFGVQRCGIGIGFEGVGLRCPAASTPPPSETLFWILIWNSETVNAR